MTRDDAARSPDAARGPAEDTPPLTGAVLAGRYVLGGLLGKGGMGRVYAAQDRTLSREVAVKVLASESPDPESLRRFQREALATSSVQHPNVVAVFDAGEEQGRPFIVTELLRGQNLRERFAAGPLPLAETLQIARQAAAGLAAAHEKGLTHRDFKPENIFITHDGWVKILDFGLVKLAEDLRTRQDDEPRNDEEAVTGVGRMLGTVGYMAPEQVRGRPVDPRADLFNFGAVLYEMLCGKRAFRGNSPTETGYATLFKQPEPLGDETPRPLRELVTRCLEKEPQKRFVSAKELLVAIEALISRPPPKPSRLSFRLRISRRAWFGAGAAVALAALLVAGLRMKRPAPVNAGPPPSGTVAILPFSARDAVNFAFLGEGIVELLARDLEGTDLRAVDSGSVLRALGGDAAADLDRVRAAAAQVSARYFLLGRIEERQGELVMEAVLHAQDTGLPVSQAVANGPSADMLRLVRKLSDQLQLRTLPSQEFEARLEKLAKRTSRSPKALEAWLEGERMIKRGNNFAADQLIAVFQRAVEADPEFALVHYRLAHAASLWQPGLAEDSLQRAMRNSDRLTPTERMLVEGRLAIQQGRFRDAESIFLEATKRYPDDAGAWWELAELYFHENPLRARSPQEAQPALERVLVIDPMNTEVMTHLIDLAQMRGERGLVSRLSDRLVPLLDGPSVPIYRIARAWARDDVAERQSVLDDLRASAGNRDLLNHIFLRAEWQMDVGLAEQVSHLFARSDSATDQSHAHRTLGFVKLLRGQPQSAKAEIARAVELHPGGDGSASYFLPWVSALEFLPQSAAQLAAARGETQRIVIDTPVMVPAKLHLAGTLAARAGDFVAAESAARELERMPPLSGSSVTADLALAVRAHVLAARGKPEAALELLEKQELRIPARYSPFYGRIAESWLRAELLEALHRPREALKLYDAFAFYGFYEPIFASFAHLRKARVFEELGDREGAIDHYARFIALWKDCEPEERPEVERAQSRLSALRATGPTIAGH